MTSIDDIMNMLDWNRDPQTQEQGISLARQIKDLGVFLQPMGFGSKAVWNNCAKILAEKTDDELEPYLVTLLEWLQDFNWPGTLIILERLKFFSGEKIKEPFIRLVTYSMSLKNEEGLMWLDNLSELLDNEELKAELPKEIFETLQKHFHNWAWWYKG